ncbi:MAG: hypothetical protein ACE5EJ_04870 [Nitrosopumilaceae archaeon]
MKTKTILPEIDEMRKKILEANVKTPSGELVTEEVLDKLLAEKSKIVTFKKNPKLAYKVIATFLGVPIEVSRSSFAISDEETLPSDKFLLIADIQTTSYKVVSIRGYLLGVFGHRKTKNDNDMAFFSIADESGVAIGTIFGKDAIKIFEEDVGQWNPIMISNILLRDVNGTKMFSINNKTGVFLISKGDYDLPHISQISTTPIEELQSDDYVLVKGIVVALEEEEVFVCDNLHILSVQEENTQIPCTKSPCDNSIAISRTALRYNLVVGDETGEVSVSFYPSFEPKTDFVIGKGIIVRGKYRNDFNNISGYDYYVFDFIEKEEEEVKENPINYNWDDIDIDADDPTKDDIEAISQFWENVVRKYAPITPAVFQDFLNKRYKTKYKMQPIIEHLINNSKAEVTKNDQGVFAIK